MEILVLIETFCPVDQPTAKCLLRLIENSNHHFLVISKGKRKALFHGSNWSNFQIDSYYQKLPGALGCLKWLIYKLFFKLASIFKPSSLFDSRRFVAAGSRVIRRHHIDMILAVSGWFSAQQAAQKLSERHHVPFVSWYTDPFIASTNNSRFRVSKIKRIEAKWLRSTRFVLMPKNYKNEYDCAYQNFCHKFRVVELPCFLPETVLDNEGAAAPTQPIILHAGLMASRVGDLSWIHSFIESLSDFFFVSLEHPNTFYLDHPFPSNFARKDRLDGDDYLKAVSSSSALLVIDNLSGIQIPSKAFESLSTDKPILFVYHREESPTLRLMKKAGNVFCIKEGTLVTEKILRDMKDYIGLGHVQHALPYTNEEECSKILDLLKEATSSQCA